MSWSPDDEDPPAKPRGLYRNSTSMCGCDMCSEAGAYSTDLDKEDVE